MAQGQVAAGFLERVAGYAGLHDSLTGWRLARLLRLSAAGAEDDALARVGAALELIEVAARLHFGAPGAEPLTVLDPIAVAEGDHLFARALELVVPLRNPEIVDLTALAIADVAAGSILDVPASEEAPEGDSAPDVGEARELRGALYRVAAELGAVLSGASVDRRAELRSAGVQVAVLEGTPADSRGNAAEQVSAEVARSLPGSEGLIAEWL